MTARRWACDRETFQGQRQGASDTSTAVMMTLCCGSGVMYVAATYKRCLVEGDKAPCTQCPNDYTMQPLVQEPPAIMASTGADPLPGGPGSGGGCSSCCDSDEGAPASAASAAQQYLQSQGGRCECRRYLVEPGLSDHVALMITQAAVEKVCKSAPGLELSAVEVAE